MSDDCRADIDLNCEHCRHRDADRGELLLLLDLIVCEFRSDPMSQQCFDYTAIVKPAIELVDRLKAARVQPLIRTFQAGDRVQLNDRGLEAFRHCGVVLECGVNRTVLVRWDNRPEEWYYQPELLEPEVQKP